MLGQGLVVAYLGNSRILTIEMIPMFGLAIMEFLPFLLAPACQFVSYGSL